MNKIEMKKIQKSSHWIDYEWFIDDVRLSDHLHEKKNTELPNNLELFDDLLKSNIAMCGVIPLKG